MNKKQSKEPMSKRQKIKEQRLKRQRQQRLLTIGVIVLIALVLVALLVIPTLQQSLEPVGEFTLITPVPRQLAKGLSIGDPNAPVKIDIFEDFQCSACQNYTLTVEPRVISEIVETGKAYYTFHNYPFMDDRAAEKASDRTASAAMCAAEQNRFWDYKDMLYTNLNHVEGEFSPKRLIAFAKALGLDERQFSKCLEENPYQADIDADLQLGSQMGVSGTPTVFVNGVDVKPGYVPSFEEILQAVEAALNP